MATGSMRLICASKYASYPISWILLLTVLTFCWRHLYRKQIRPHIAPTC